LRRDRAWFAAFLFLAGCGCTGGGGGQGEGILVFVSIAPQAAFVERVGGDHVTPHVLVPPGRSPATYEPTPKQVAKLGEAKVFFCIGVPFEKGFLDELRSTHPDLEIVDTREGIELRRMRSSSGAGRPGEGWGDDPHIWLDPLRVKRQAKTICDALVRLDPGHRDAYESNLEAFRKDLDAVNDRIADTLAPLKGKKLFVFHPSFGYFADRYGLEQVSVEAEGKEPGPKQLAGLIEQAEQAGAKVIFVQPQFSTKSARTVARALDGKVVTLDPLARNSIENLETMASRIREALAP